MEAEKAEEHRSATAQSENSTPSLEKEKETGPGGVKQPQHLEAIRTVSRVPGNPNYYEKDGLRTYGDDEDHDHEPPVSGTNLSCACKPASLTRVLDDHSPIDVLGCHGIFMDGIADSRIPVW